MNTLLTPEIKADMEAGIETIRADEPTDAVKRDKAIAAMMELQIRRAQSIEIGRVKLTGWLAVVATAAVLIAIAVAVDIPECIKAWKTPVVAVSP